MTGADRHLVSELDGLDVVLRLLNDAESIDAESIPDLYSTCLVCRAVCE